MFIRRRPRQALALALSVAAALLLSACGFGGSNAGATRDTDKASITIDHARGRIEVPRNPGKVFVFDLGLLDTLDQLHVPVAGVPRGSAKTFPDYLKKYDTDKYVNIGSLKEPNFETINAEAPDLILITGRTASSYDELSKIAPTIDMSTPKDQSPYSAFQSNATKLGKIFDKEQAVQDQLRKISELAAETKQLGTKAGTGLTVMISGAKITAYGSGSRFGLINDVLGIQPAVQIKAGATHGEAVSFEFIAEAKPENLFVIDRDAALGEPGESARKVLDNELVRSTPASQKNRIIMLDAKLWYIVGFGLNNTEQMIQQVKTGLSS